MAEQTACNQSGTGSAGGFKKPKRAGFVKKKPFSCPYLEGKGYTLLRDQQAASTFRREKIAYRCLFE